MAHCIFEREEPIAFMALKGVNITPNVEIEYPKPILVKKSQPALRPFPVQEYSQARNTRGNVEEFVHSPPQWPFRVSLPVSSQNAEGKGERPQRDLEEGEYARELH